MSDEKTVEQLAEDGEIQFIKYDTKPKTVRKMVAVFQLSQKSFFAYYTRDEFVNGFNFAEDKSVLAELFDSGKTIIIASDGIQCMSESLFISEMANELMLSEYLTAKKNLMELDYESESMVQTGQ